jgi:RimJ/RimL family protein N-acetyltransferase
VGQSSPTSRHRERAYFEASAKDPDYVGALVWSGEERVGVVEFDPVDRETGVAELGLWTHPDHQREGYASEAVRLFVDYAFSELRMHKVTANAYGVNEGSRRLLESAGFVEEGIGREDAFFDGSYRDTHYYGVLESEWRERT